MAIVRLGKVFEMQSPIRDFLIVKRKKECINHVKKRIGIDSGLLRKILKAWRKGLIER